MNQIKVAKFVRCASTALAVLLSMAVMALIPAIRSAGTLDTDGWFLLASGRVVVESGIPSTNPFTAIAGQGIVLQQWLHDTWLYLYWKAAGYAGVAVSVAVPAALALWAYTGTVSRLARNARHPWAPLLIGALGFTLMASYLSIRPSLWTAALLFVAISSCLEWRRGADKRYLFALPVVSLLSVNLQAALWPLPAAAAACFLLPEEGEFEPSNTCEALRAWSQSRLPLLAAIAGMVAESLVNPYAIDGSLYVLRSLGAASYGGVILELKPMWAMPEAAPFWCVAVLAASASCALARRFPPRWLLAFWLTSAIAGALAVRCLWITWTVSFLIVAVSAGRKEELEPRTYRALIAGRVTLSLVLALSVINSGLRSIEPEASGVESGWCGIDADMVQIVEALGDDPGRIWTEDVSVMNYLEWAKVPVTYDMRPEIWSEAIAGDGADNDYRLYVDSLQGGYGRLKEDGWAWAIVMDSHGKHLEKACPDAEKTADGRGYSLYRL